MIEGLRRWARRHTEQSRYSPIGIAFHWTMAALVIFQLGWGWYAGLVAAGGNKLLAYQIHGDVGLLILVLAVLRLAWRTIIPGPVNDADTQGWQTKIAYVTHYIFYLCFFGLPLSGWAMWSALGPNAPLAVGGIVPWPALPFDRLPTGLQWAIMDYAEDVHHLLILLLTALVPLHAAAALKHHFWDRHDVLRGMLPEIPDAKQPGRGKRHAPRPIGSPQA
ncbi:cytochrome b [Sphingosinicella terrae]|uniref:cytochrome b n=1 Tax=Sphingosinicella terrae TaxID=2172047 RepID=UPI000E0DCDBC|nr:cytochrome b [Sphingosinicella terrae]